MHAKVVVCQNLKSQAKCLKWLTKAAEQGDEKAQYNLAKLGNLMLRQR